MRLWWFDLAAEDRLAYKIAKAVWEGFSGETSVTVDPVEKTDPSQIW